MRPLLVLALVIGALGALLFAVLNVKSPGAGPGLGGSAESDETGLTSNDPGAASLAPVDDQGPPGAAAQDGGTARETAATDGVTHYENALTGLVVDQRGSPVERAKVVITKATPQAAFFVTDPRDRSQDRRAFTDAEGRYRFENVEPFDFYSLLVTHDDYSRATEPNVRVGETGEFVERDIRLRRGSTLAGYVRDESGTGIAGAVITLYQGPQFLAGDAQKEQKLARSGADGRYEIRNIAPGLYNLSVHANGFGNLTVANVTFDRSKRREKDYVMKTAEMIGGRVLGPGGAPVLNASINATSYGGKSKQISRGQDASDSRGAFRIDDLRPGTFALTVSAPGYKPERVQRVETGNLGVTVRLTLRAVVSGRVLDAATNRPIPRGQVELRHVHEHNPVTNPAGIEAAFQDADGRYELRGVPPGNYVVDAAAPGYAPTFSAKFTVTEGRNIPGIDVRLTLGGSISGRILDPRGEPVEGARVTTHDNSWGDDPLARILGGDFPTNTTSRAVRSDGDGRFQLRHLRADAYQVRVHSDDYCTVIKYDVRVVEGGDHKLGDLRLSKGGIVRGTLFDKGGERLAGGELKLNANVPPGSPPIVFQAKSDSDGRFRFQGIPPGAYKLSATVPPGPDVHPLERVLETTLSERPVIVRENEAVNQDMTIGG